MDSEGGGGVGGKRIMCGLDCPNVPDLADGLAYVTEQCPYSFVCLPAVHPRLRRLYAPGGSAVATAFARSDLALDSEEWNARVVARVSPYLTADARDEAVRLRHEDCLREELDYCRGIGVTVAVVPLHSGRNHNLARIIGGELVAHAHHQLGYWIETPMEDRRRRAFGRRPAEGEGDAPGEDTWRWWSDFHRSTHWDRRVALALILSADLPGADELERWLGEPIRCLVIPTNVFLTNKKQYPCLSRPHQAFVKRLLERDVQLMVTGASRHQDMKMYVKYLQFIWSSKPPSDAMTNYAKGWEDYLQTPLQPLSDNLDSYTYNVFEKDPIKYDNYQDAILEALRVRYRDPPLCACGKRSLVEETGLTSTSKDENESEENAAESNTEDSKDSCVCKHFAVVMVLGAGRGPLVRAVLNAAKMANVNVKVYAVEKNPVALVTLHSQQREIWGDRVTVVASDMRKFKPEHLADIIVSELLGSFGDNELSPECLDGARHLLKEDGISIPCSYTSYLCPVMCPRLWGYAKGSEAMQLKSGNAHPLETPWVVYQQNKYEISPPQPLFTFTHPCPPGDGSHVERRRWKALRFPVNLACTLHGFTGYFDCVLYDKHTLSIVPETHSPSMISWFPIYFPIKCPLNLKSGDTIEVNFWRCSDARKVWYEWSVISPELQLVHNFRGKSSNMIL